MATGKLDEYEREDQSSPIELDTEVNASGNRYEHLSTDDLSTSARSNADQDSESSGGQSDQVAGPQINTGNDLVADQAANDMDDQGSSLGSPETSIRRENGGNANAHTGSGTDLNSDTRRLHNPDNLQDKAEEDTFPASDPPSSSSPLTSFGRSHAGHGHSARRGPPELPKDFKDNPAAQFEYGRRTEEKTHHFDTSTRRFEMGNPDIGEVDLGTIQADEPAEPDDYYDDADEIAEDLGQRG